MSATKRSPAERVIRNPVKAGDTRRVSLIPVAALACTWSCSHSGSAVVGRYRYRRCGQAAQARRWPAGVPALAAARKRDCATRCIEGTGRRGRRPKRRRRKTTRAKVKAAKADTVQALSRKPPEARKANKLRTARTSAERELKRLVYPVIGDVPLSTSKRSQIRRWLGR